MSDTDTPQPSVRRVAVAGGHGLTRAEAEAAFAGQPEALALILGQIDAFEAGRAVELTAVPGATLRAVAEAEARPCAGCGCADCGHAAADLTVTGPALPDSTVTETETETD